MSPPELGDRALLGHRPRRGPLPLLPAVQVDDTERFLLRLFLTRYVTWCARSQRQHSIPGAVALFRSLG